MKRDNSILYSQIFRRIFLYILLFFLFFTVANIFESVRCERARLFAEAESDILFAAHEVESLLPRGVSSGRAPDLGPQLAALEKAHRLSYLIITDANYQKVWYSKDRHALAERLPGLVRGAPVAASGKHLEFCEASLEGTTYYNMEVKTSGEPHFIIHAGLMASSFNPLSGSFYLKNIFGHGAVFFVLIILLALYYKSAVLVPLASLAGYARRAASGDSEVKPATGGAGEVGELSGAICDLADDFASRVSGLEEQVRQAALNLDAARVRLAAVMDNMGDGLVMLDRSGHVLMCNRAALEFLGVAECPQGKRLGLVLDNPGEEFPGMKNLPGPWRNFLSRLESGEDFQAEVLLHRAAAEVYLEALVTNHKDVTICLLRNASGRRKAEEHLRHSHDILEQTVQERTGELMRLNAQLRLENAERRTVEQALLRAEARYRDIVDNAIEGIFQRAPDGCFLSANLSLARILGYASVEDLMVVYMTPGELLCHTEEMEKSLTELLEMRGWVSNLEFQVRTRGGAPVWVSMNARRVAGPDGNTLYYEAFMEDITSRKKSEDKLVHQAFHDPLTGLPNRVLFQDRLRMAMRKARRREGYCFAVLYLDLDRFKVINDSFGHSAGDEVLRHAANILKICVREMDTVARFGGDEFALLLDDLEYPATAVRVAKRIRLAMEEPMLYQGQEVRTGASVGVVISKGTYQTPEEILRDADTAMYRAKNSARGSFKVFNQRMRVETMEIIALENDLRKAVGRGELFLHYQPLVEIKTGRAHGFEALLRWNRPSQGLVPPSAFIPVAEDAGLINEIGLHMLRAVCSQICAWQEQEDIGDLSVHVNISGRQLMAPRFAAEVQAILDKIQVSPRRLIFEITESVLLDYGGHVTNMMQQLRELGIRFCLDDFGTGFSSLSYLRLLPLESLKMDRSFLVDLETNHQTRAILRNLLSMGNDIGLTVITEGVERAEQASWLLDAGCRYGQGYFFAKPLDSGEAFNFIKKRK